MKVSSKRQVTLPISQCAEAHIDKGDEVKSFVDRHGVISIVKQSKGAARGILSNVKANPDVSDEEH